MVFPDVRLKQFIEIRMPDSLPYPYNLGVAALIKGIFYNSRLLEKYYEKSLGVDDAWVEHQNDNLKKSVIDDALQALKHEILGDVIEALSDDERPFMKRVLEVYENEGSFTALMQRTYRADLDAFKQLIKIQEVIK
jgi:glutamate--cysteine ligase